jgi:lipopolysaccharide transport system permease protein
VLSGLVDFAIGFSLLLIFIAANGIHPTMRILWLPAFLLLAIATALGAGLWLSALNVEYRDVRYVVPFLVQLWMFATPVAYPSSLLREPFRTMYALNPLAGVVEGFRWALLGSSHTPTSMLLVSSAMAVFAVVSGAFYFRRMEKTFADLI